MLASAAWRAVRRLLCVWHRNLFALAQAAGWRSIASLSYELFDAYCPESWKQRTASGDPALTGWVPPSTLLSPANPQAMGWLAEVAAQPSSRCSKKRACRSASRSASRGGGLRPRGQICLYDDAAKAAFGGNPPVIANIAAPLDAAATCAARCSGRAAGAVDRRFDCRCAELRRRGPSEVLLLAFTPTILDPATPELYRANLPTGWAAPAFDRLQLEDYDWLTAGADAARRAAYALVDARLGYPLADQDYLAGFVLNPADAERDVGAHRQRAGRGRRARHHPALRLGAAAGQPRRLHPPRPSAGASHGTLRQRAVPLRAGPQRLGRARVFDLDRGHRLGA